MKPKVSPSRRCPEPSNIKFQSVSPDAPPVPPQTPPTRGHCATVLNFGKAISAKKFKQALRLFISHPQHQRAIVEHHGTMALKRAEEDGDTKFVENFRALKNGCEAAWAAETQAACTAHAKAQAQFDAERWELVEIS